MSEQPLLEALQVLKEHSFKFTKKREAILRYLITKNKYVNAKEIYDDLTKEYSGMSYDTIYRNLKDFRTLGLVEETELQGEKKFRYQCKQTHFAHHHHFICTSCGATKEIKMCPMDYFKEQLEGYAIEGHRFEILGKCPLCLANQTD